MPNDSEWRMIVIIIIIIIILLKNPPTLPELGVLELLLVVSLHLLLVHKFV